MAFVLHYDFLNHNNVLIIDTYFFFLWKAREKLPQIPKWDEKQKGVCILNVYIISASILIKWLPVRFTQIFRSEYDVYILFSHYNCYWWFGDAMSWDPFLLWPLLLAWIPAWISNHMPSRVWDEINHPFPNFNGCTNEVWDCIGNFTIHLTMDVITYLRWV